MPRGLHVFPPRVEGDSGLSQAFWDKGPSEQFYMEHRRRRRLWWRVGTLVGLKKWWWHHSLNSVRDKRRGLRGCPHFWHLQCAAGLGLHSHHWVLARPLQQIVRTSQVETGWSLSQAQYPAHSKCLQTSGSRFLRGREWGCAALGCSNVCLVVVSLCAARNVCPQGDMECVCVRVHEHESK